MTDHGGVYVGDPEPEWDGPDPLMEMVAKARAVCRKPKGHDTALRWALADMVAFSAFLASCVRSGERMTDEDERLLAERQAAARAALL